jgi:hypothetical protein
MPVLICNALTTRMDKADDDADLIESWTSVLPSVTRLQHLDT